MWACLQEHRLCSIQQNLNHCLATSWMQVRATLEAKVEPDGHEEATFKDILVIAELLFQANQLSVAWAAPLLRGRGCPLCAGRVCWERCLDSPEQQALPAGTSTCRAPPTPSDPQADFITGKGHRVMWVELGIRTTLTLFVANEKLLRWPQCATKSISSKYF